MNRVVGSRPRKTNRKTFLVTCRVCKRSFFPWQNTQVVCSRGCAAIARRNGIYSTRMAQRRGRLAKEVRKCINCFRAFRPWSEYQRVCSRVCQTAYSQAPAATEHPTPIDIAWAAGIFEGEGSTNSTGTLMIYQREPWLLYRLQSLFGGMVKESTDNPTSWGRCGSWTITGGRARGFAMTIYKFLSPHRKEQLIMRIISKPKVA